MASPSTLLLNCFKNVVKFQRMCFCRYSPSYQVQEVYLKQDYKERRKRDEVEEEPLLVTEENQYKLLNDVVTPLCNKPYEEQIRMKWMWSRYVRNTFATSRNKKLCRINEVIKSPMVDYYRNKSEFSIRSGIDGNPKTLGYFIGVPKKGEVVCVPPTYLLNTPQRHKDIAKSYEDFIRRSILPACHNFHDGGYWRGVAVKTNSEGDTMVITYVHPQDKSDEEIQDNMEQLRIFFQETHPDITSLYHQASKQTRSTNEEAPYTLLSGDPFIYENINGYRFRISPDSFFQVNKGAAELMYLEILRMAQLKSYSVLLDLCCGTGVISILGSKHAHKCAGVDMVKQSVMDAKENALLNNVSNCTYHWRKIETIPKNVLETLDSTGEVVCVLNPGRTGVVQRVIKTIRSTLPISRVIYVSCKADFPGTIKNFRDLLDHKFCDSPPFQVKEITPVDLFPHTHHFQRVIKTIRSTLPISRVIYVSCKADFPGTIKNFRDLLDQKFCDSPPFQVKEITPVDLFPHTHHCELLLLFER